MTEKENFVIPKNIRLPERLYARLEAEAEYRGIGQPAVMARMIIIERLKKTNLETLAEIVKANPAKPAYGIRITVRLTERQMKVINEAATFVFRGNISKLFQSILIERYGEGEKQL